MRLRTGLFLVLVLPLMGSCDLFSSPCRDFCVYEVECFPEHLDDLGFGSCDWDDGEDDAMEECMDACKDEWKKSSSSEREEVTSCIRCVQDDLDGSCDYDDWYDSTFDDCDDECDDDDVDEFFEDVFNEWDGDLDCDSETGVYGYTG